MRRFLFACGMSLGVVMSLTASAGAACLPSTREVTFPDGSVRMKAYSCSLTDGGDPVLQVEFNRLSETTAGSLIEASPYVDLQTTYGPWNVLHNDVYKTAKELFDQFGTRQVLQACFSFQLSSALAGQSFRHTFADACNEEQRTFWYFSYPREVAGSIPLPESSWNAGLEAHALPAGWRVSYGDCPQGIGSLLECAVLWRMIDASDLKRFAKKLGSRNLGGGGAAFDAWPRYLRLVEHITEGGIPGDFLVWVKSFGCACGTEDGVYIRRLVLHTAFLKNISNEDLVIDGLIQAHDESEALRPYVDGQSPRSTQSSTIAPLILSPGQTIVIPLRLNFFP